MPKTPTRRHRPIGPDNSGKDSKATVNFGTPGHPSLSLLADWITSGCSEEAWARIDEASEGSDACSWMRRSSLHLKAALPHKLLCYCLAHATLPNQGEHLPQGKAVSVQEALSALGLMSPMDVCMVHDLLKEPYSQLSDYLQIGHLGPNPSTGDFLSAELEIPLPAVARLLEKPPSSEAATPTWESLCLPSSVRSQVEALLAAPPDETRPFWLAFVGTPGSGRRSLGRGIAAHLGKKIVTISDDLEPSPQNILGLGQSEEGVWDSDPRTHLKDQGWVFLCANSADDPLVAMADIVLDLAIPDPVAVGAFTTQEAQKVGLEIPANCAQSIVERFQVPPAHIKLAIDLAGRRARFGGAKAEEHAKYLEEGLQSVSAVPPQPAKRFGREPLDSKSLIEKAKPRLRREDLVLAPALGESLDRCIRAVQTRGTLLRDWGLDERLLPSSKGIFLFHGPSGTGKSMAAEVMAGELGLDLWRIQASQLQNPFVGETEQRITALFKSLKHCNAVVLLDEVDNFLLDRTRDMSTAKVHNQGMVNAFLRELDVFEGILVFTTNLSEDLDPAVERRIPYRLCFPLPGEAERVRIWQNLWRETIPQDGSVDLAELARRFPLPGGLIRNAFLAACQRGAETGRMTQQALLDACRDEDESRLKRETSRRIRGFAA